MNKILAIVSGLISGRIHIVRSEPSEDWSSDKTHN
jgi:hypothetical protein